MLDLARALDRERVRRRLPSPTARRRLRLRAGISLAVIAREIGVTPASVSRWESGAREPAACHLDGYVAVLDRLAGELANGGGA